MPPAAKAASAAFRGLAMHIANGMDMKFGAVILKLAGIYNRLAKGGKEMDAVESTKKAKALFDKDSKDARMKHLKEAERAMAEKKAAKKAKKAAQ